MDNARVVLALVERIVGSPRRDVVSRGEIHSKEVIRTVEETRKDETPFELYSARLTAYFPGSNTKI